MIRYILSTTIVLLLCMTARGDTLRVVIDDFTPGLVTAKSDRAMRPGEAKVVDDLDLNKNPGALTKRLGYDSLFTIPGLDSLLWNMPLVVQYSDGSKEMLLIGDSLGVGYANLYSTTANGIQMGVTDSFYVRFDYRKMRDTVKAYSANGNIRYVISQVVGDSTLSLTMLIDTAKTINNIVDSLADSLNTVYDTWTTADTLADTQLVMVENAVNTELTLTVTPYYRIYDEELAGYKYYQITGAATVTSAGLLTPTDTIPLGTYIPATGVPQSATFNDKTYIVNGVGRGLVYDGRNTQPFPLQASGEVLAVPLTTAGTLNGRYRYCLRAVGDSVVHADTLIANRWGYLSQPIVVDSGQVLLYGFPRRTYDWRYAAGDSVTYEIWRTVGTVGRLDKLDSIWNTGMTVQVTSANYTTVTVTDTMSDVTLRTKAGKAFVDGDLYGWSSQIRGDAKYTYYRRPGAPALFGFDSITTGRGIWDDGGLSSDSVVDWGTCAGFSVLVIGVDTAQDIPSDSGVSFNFYQEGNPQGYNRDTTGSGDSLAFSRQATERLKMVMPRPYNTDIVYLVYRGPIEAKTFDTTTGGGLTNGTYFINGEVLIYRDGKWYDLAGNYRPEVEFLIPFETNWGAEFFIPYYFFVGKFNPGDTVYDTLGYHQLTTADGYERNAIPAVANAVAAFDNRLFMADGSFIQYSTSAAADTQTAFLTFNRVPINPDDGDQVTALWPEKDGLAVAKTKSKYLLYKNASGGYESVELAAHYGALSPLSVSVAPEGTYFLSHDGVRLEAEGLYKERSTIGSLMSGNLNNFTKQPVTTMRQSVGVYYDNKYLLSVPSLDTTYVLHKITMPDGSYRYSWATWSMEFSGAALYAVSASNDFIPPDSLYFTKPGKSSLYRYGSSTKDNARDVEWQWQSGPIGVMDGRYWQVDEVALWTVSTDTVASAVTCAFVHDSISTSGTRNHWSDFVLFPALNSDRFHSKSVAPSAKRTLYWEALLGSVVSKSSNGYVIIDGLELTLTDKGPKRSQ